MKTIYYIVSAIIVSVLSPLAVQAAPPVSIELENGGEVIVLKLENPDGKVFTIENPSRLVVDLRGLRLTKQERNAVSLPKSYKKELIKDVRIGQFDADTSRLVFDLSGSVTIEGTSQNDRRLRIEIAPVKGKKSGSDGRQPLIVIDPGHGGQDPGTISPDGVQEKDIVLEYARILRGKLQQSGKYQVVLTRDDDRYIKLRQRSEIARKENASLFISLHADSAPHKVRGLSVYTVSEKASDEETAALAAHENKSDIIAGVDLTEEREDVADILISLMQRETMNRSAAAADYIVAALANRVQLLPKSHRFAGFAVLKAPDVPSVLIELGFLSDSEDRKLLKSKAYRDKVTDGIVAGVDAYFRNKKKAGTE